MVSVVLLGTGTPNLDPHRGGSGTAVVADGGWVLVDCGRAVTQRIAEAGLDLAELRAVLLTHHHSDHVSDLAPLAIAHWSTVGSGPLPVVAPAGPCAEFARRCLDPFPDQSFHAQTDPESGPRPRIEVRSFVAPAAPGRVPLDEPWRVSSALVDHHPIEAAVGYRIEIAGVTVVVSGDTAVGGGIESLSSGADLLVHEALLEGRVSPTLLTWNASATSVGAMAQRAGVRRLVLSHLLPAPGSAQDEADFADDARAGGYDGPIVVARDLMRIPVAPR